MILAVLFTEHMSYETQIMFPAPFSDLSSKVLRDTLDDLPVQNMDRFPNEAASSAKDMRQKRIILNEADMATTTRSIEMGTYVGNETTVLIVGMIHLLAKLRGRVADEDD